ncbi:MAG: Fic family protein [Bacteroidales bacterium]|nr:Fic family protein [Bacteroidales bacterium]
MKSIEKAPDSSSSDLLNKGARLLTNKDFQLIASDINEKYLYWNKVKYYKTPEGISPNVLWAVIKFTRTINAKVINFGKYRFTYNLTDPIQKELHEFDLHIGGELGTKSIIPEEGKKRYLISSIMEEAIASSQIEGAVTTRKVAKEMLRKSINPKNKSEQMIVNNYLTIKHIVDIQNESLTLEKLFEIHRLITNKTLDDSADEGRYREDNEVNVVDVTDGEIVHTPPDFKEVPQLMNELIQFFNENNSNRFIHPIIKGCIIHFMVGYIHPFVDGNGRTARALFYWYLLKSGYWLTEYLSISRLIIKSKTQYAQAFLYSEVDENDLTYFINYKMKTMQLAYQSLREYIQRKINEKKQVINFQKIKGVNERQSHILKWIYEEPDLLFSVKEIENRFSVSNQTARTDLMELEKRGYLEGIDTNKKTKGFCRSEIFLELLEKELPKAMKNFHN